MFDIIKETLKMILQQQLNITLIISSVVTCVLLLIAYAYYIEHKYSKRNILFRLTLLTMLRKVLYINTSFRDSIITQSYKKIYKYIHTWEQRKLLTVLNKIVDYRGRTPKKLGLDWSLNGHLALSALNVKMGYVDKTVDAHYGDDHLYSVWMKDNDLYEGQVLFTTEAPMGNVAQVPDNNKYILSQRTIAFVPDRSVISDNFLAVVLSASKCQKSLINRASGGTAKGVSQKTLSEIFLDIPQSLSEQDKVSELIKKLSKIITLHQ